MGRWLVRGILIVAAFLVGTVVAGFLLVFVTWSQSLIDVLGVAVGIAFAVVVGLKTRPLTHP